MSNLLGTAVGRYQLEALLGVGGMAEVYRAVDRGLGRTVAVKVVLAGIAAQTEFRERFSREARLVAALEHPNIAPIYDVGEHQGLPYLVMPYYEGGSLAARLDGKPLPTPLTGRWLTDLAQALDAAHASGVLHRDVKPSNVLIDSHGRALLADFGVALAANAMTRLTTTGAVVGTPGYMAPELAMGEHATPASDRYSLAVLAYELVTGRVPFSGESAIAVLHQHATRPVPPIREHLPGATEELDHVLRRGLAKRPEERTATAAAFAVELTAVLARLAPSLPESPTSPTRELAPGPIPAVWPAKRKPSARRKVLGWLGMATLVVAGAFGGLLLWRALEPGPAEEISESAALNAEALKIEPTPTTSAPETGESPPTPEPAAVKPRAEPQPAPASAAASPPSEPPAVDEQSAAVDLDSTTTDPAATDSPPHGLSTAEASAEESEPLRLPAMVPGAGGGRRLNGLRTREVLRRTQRLTAQDFAEIAARSTALSRRPVDAAKGAAMAAFARGGQAYLDGRLDEAATVLLELASLPGMATLAGGPGPLPLMVLREHATGTPVKEWELAVGYGDARNEGIDAADAALAATPGDSRLLLGRAQLHRFDGNHTAAIADAEASLQAHTKYRAGAVAMFVAEEYAALANYSQALDWYRRAVAEGGRVGSAAAMEAARLAEERLRDRSLVIEFLKQACQLGQVQACRRVERINSGS